MAAQPPSPWLQRFNEIEEADVYPEILKKDNLKHSGLAIEYPRRDPRFYNDPLTREQAYSMPIRGNDYDRLFFSEEFQKQGFLGSATWELTELNRFLWTSHQYGLTSGGHLTADDPAAIADVHRQRLIQVDETRWFGFLQKSRWYNLSANPQEQKPPGPGLRWSVDDPMVWHHLRGSIELVDRILKSLIQDQHSALETLLFGRLLYYKNIPSMANQRPFDDALALLSPQMDRTICYANEWPLYQSEFSLLAEGEKPRAMAWKLETLARGHLWSFAPEPRPRRAWDYTKTSRHHNLSFINSELLRHLCSSNITMAESFMLQFQITVVMVRELMRSLFATRLNDDGAPNNITEPFVDFDAVAQIGQAMEKRIFGGHFKILPVENSIPVSIALIHWPNVLSKGIGNPLHETFEKEHPIKIERYPALYIAKFFSEESWTWPLRIRKSDRHFWRMRLFDSETPVRNGGVREWNGIKINDKLKSEWRLLEQRLVNSWTDNRDAWREYRRHWYDAAFERWASTPWGKGVIPRQLVDGFAVHFANRDEVLCFEAPRVLVGTEGRPGMMNWEVPHEFSRSLPGRNNRNNAWVFFTIGLLMLAAMPAREADYTPEEINPSTRLFSFEPSLECAAARALGWTAPPRLELPEPERFPRTRPRSICYDPAIQGQRIPYPTQMDYLDLVRLIMRHIAQTEASVSQAWVHAILLCSESLRAQREEFIITHPHDHRQMWARSWDFQVPDYDHDNPRWIFWDNTYGGRWMKGEPFDSPPPPF
ncbi:hypothetical protein F5Y10DRAFT_138000 [Nemania abortiva]|nr:hypothetical protein F5Y10DRAFT_138000 [Nemania abortiva]